MRQPYFLGSEGKDFHDLLVHFFQDKFQNLLFTDFSRFLKVLGLKFGTFGLTF